MKRLLVVFILVALLVFSVAGCGIKQKMEEKAAEQFLESIGGGNVDINDDDSITIKGEDGEEVTLGSTDWPTSELSKALPAFTAGKIESVLDSEEYIMISILEVAKADFQSYMENVKTDFAENAYSVDSDGVLSYGGSNGQVEITLSYTEEDQTVIISMAKSAQE